MKKLILLFTFIPFVCFSQTKLVFFAHEAYIVPTNNEEIRTMTTDFKITINNKLKIIFILTDKSEDIYTFYKMEVRNFNDGKGDRTFFEFSENQYYKTLMLWFNKGQTLLMFSPVDKEKESLFFKNPKILE